MRLLAQVVRSALANEKGKDVVVYWYLEAIEMPPKPWGFLSARPLMPCTTPSAC